MRAESDLVSLTPPAGARIAEQMTAVCAAMDLRTNRLPKIIAQSDGFVAFFAAQMPFGPNRQPSTAHLISTMHDAVVKVERRMKHLCSVPRPVILSPQMQPIISTPGHATKAFAHASILAALRLSAAGVSDAELIEVILTKLPSAVEAAPATDPLILLYRLADNRTDAGVHYPVDAAHGALLGPGVTLALVGHCLGGGPEYPVPDWVADANTWTRDFILRKWCAAPGGGIKLGWRAAVAEWQSLAAAGGPVA